MNNNSDLRTQSLDMLRFPLAVVVLIVHTIQTDLILHGNRIETNDMPLLLAMKDFVTASLIDQSVPVYFFISGFVFFLGGQLSKHIYIRKMKNRFKSLFIPYIIWNLFALGILWFYSDLLWGHANQLITAYFFFSFGAYMSINGKDMFQEFGRYFKLSIIAYIFLGTSYIVALHYYPEACEIIKKLNVFAGLLLAYNVAAWLLRKKICKVSPFLASSSFFIYVSHCLICINIPKLFYLLFHPTSDIGITSIYILSVIFTLSLLLSVYYLMRRFTPKLLKIITGRK